MTKKHTKKLLGRNNDHTTGNLLDYEYFSKHYKLTAIDLSKQIELENPDLKEQINLIGRVERNRGATMFSITENSEETTFKFTQNTATVVWFWPCLKMETQKFANLIMNLQNLQQDNGMLSMITITQTIDNGVFIAVSLKYLSNFWRSFEIPLINCKIHLELNRTNECVMYTIADTKFKKTNRKLFVPIVTSSSKNNLKLVELWDEEFKRPVSWNEYQTKIESRNLNYNNLTRFPLDACFQGVRRLLVLAFDNTDNCGKVVERKSPQNIFFQG